MLLVGHQLRGGLRIAEYLRAYRLRPQSPLISLCVGTTYLVQVMQKNTFNRHQTVLRAFTFLQQYHLRVTSIRIGSLHWLRFTYVSEHRCAEVCAGAGTLACAGHSPAPSRARSPRWSRLSRAVAGAVVALPSCARAGEI